MTSEFVVALKNGSLELLSKCPKSDLHNHAGRGGTAKYIADWAGVEVPGPPLRFHSLSHMQEWYSNNIKVLCPGVEGQWKRWEAAFYQAGQDNIQVLALSFSRTEIEMAGGMDRFIRGLTEYRDKLSPNTIFLPELSYDRICYELVSKKSDSVKCMSNK